MSAMRVVRDVQPVETKTAFQAGVWKWCAGETGLTAVWTAQPRWRFLFGVGRKFLSEVLTIC
jgi:hypothetical protein